MWCAAWPTRQPSTVVTAVSQRLSGIVSSSASIPSMPACSSRAASSDLLMSPAYASGADAELAGELAHALEAAVGGAEIDRHVLGAGGLPGVDRLVRGGQSFGKAVHAAHLDGAPVGRGADLADCRRKVGRADGRRLPDVGRAAGASEGRVG